MAVLVILASNNAVISIIAKLSLTVPIFDASGASIGSVGVRKSAGLNLSFEGFPAPASSNFTVAFDNLEYCPHKLDQTEPSLLSGLLMSLLTLLFVGSSRFGFVAMTASQLLASHALWRFARCGFG